jgi:gliding motility-associated-like protein
MGKGFVVKGINETNYFIENKGQFNSFLSRTDSICFGVQHGSHHFFLTKSKLLWQLRKRVTTIVEESDADELKRKDIEYKSKVSTEIVELEWLNANPNCVIEAENKSNHYFTFGPEQYSSYGYQKLTYKNLYPNIDLQYIIPEKGGIKYSLILHPGANPKDIQYHYVGDNVKLSVHGNYLNVDTKLDQLRETGLIAFNSKNEKINCQYTIQGNTLGFELRMPYDGAETITIDPWITTLSAFQDPGFTKVDGCDVDYDASGNLYVYGQNGSVSLPRLAKYSPTGVLQWIFNGSLISPMWPATPSNYQSNFVVDRTFNTIYVGEAFDPALGTKVVRLNANGAYDNFISNSSPNFSEIWEMNFDCTSGKLIVMGGGIVGNHNLGLIEANGSLNTLNVTGNPDPYQDILSSTITPQGELVVAMASGLTPSLNNVLIKVNATLNGNSWIVPTGFNTFVEAMNRAYQVASNSNGFNALSSSSDFVYCYDGRNLSAYSLINGLPVGAPHTITPHTALAQGGIYADECNNVYVGGNNGNIKVFHFNGATFSALPDIVLPNLTGMHVYDLKYNQNERLLYISGEDFVCVKDSLYTCGQADSSVILARLDYDCILFAKTTVLNPEPNTMYSYTWHDSTAGTLVKTSKGIGMVSDSIQNLKIGHVYHVVIRKGDNCVAKSVTLRLHVLPSTDTVVYNVKLCKGRTFDFQGQQYPSEGQFMDTMFFANGCYQLVKLNIVNDESSNQPFFIPSAFSPNGDGKNDCFSLGHWKLIDEFELSIYNRWGEKVFGSNNVMACWNGIIKGREAEIGVYYYLIKVKNSCGEQVFKGDLSLVR